MKEGTQFVVDLESIKEKMCAEQAVVIEAWLVTYDLEYNEVKRYPMQAVVMTDMGIYYDENEANALYGIPVKVCDGDLGSLALWAEGNHGDPDCYIEYDQETHFLFDF